MQETAAVRMETVGDIAVLCIDNPPVNALSSHVVAGLDLAISRVEGTAQIKVAVVYCKGRGFIAGADLKEKPSQERSDAAAAVINRLARSPKMFLAAVHGNALGGGLEAAMACDYRCAVGDAGFGLPEVNIGAVPGYGGTQRLPRLVGMELALDMMISGRPIVARQALDTGLIDRWLTGGVREQAIRFARELVDQKAGGRKTDRNDIPDRDRCGKLCEAAASAASQTRPGEEAPGLIIDCVRNGCANSLEQGLELERTYSRSRMRAPQSLAMRYLFFAERQARKSPADSGQLKTSVQLMLKRYEHESRCAVKAGGPLQDFGKAWAGAFEDETRLHGLLAMAETGIEALNELPGLRQEHIDLEFCCSLGFPRFLGGPLYLANHREAFFEFKHTGFPPDTTDED